jgi:hypothetical protein
MQYPHFFTNLPLQQEFNIPWFCYKPFFVVEWPHYHLQMHISFLLCVFSLHGIYKSLMDWFIHGLFYNNESGSKVSWFMFWFYVKGYDKWGRVFGLGCVRPFTKQRKQPGFSWMNKYVLSPYLLYDLDWRVPMPFVYTCW